VDANHHQIAATTTIIALMLALAKDGNRGNAPRSHQNVMAKIAKAAKKSEACK
jgi:hypothetical protein